jgi:hypothetical protein
MCMQYGVDGDSDLHILSLLKGFFDGLRNQTVTTSIILEKYSQSYLDMIYTISDATQDSRKSPIILQENYLLDEIAYLQRVGEHFTTQKVLDADDLNLWETLKNIYLNLLGYIPRPLGRLTKS